MKGPRIPTLRRQAGALFLLVALAVILGAEAQTRPRELRLLHRAALPTGRSVPTDIRWAGNDSVLVSWNFDGVAEVGLDGRRRRVLVPDVGTLGGIKRYNHLASNPGLLLVASWDWTVTWRPWKAKSGGRVPFERMDVAVTRDFDLLADRFLLLGLIKRGPYAPDGVIAWLGSLSGRLEDARPVLYDVGGPGAPSFYNCANHRVGSARFLADGSFVVAPGSQDGVHLYNRSGQRVRSWTHQQLGIDSHLGCAEMTEKEEEQIRINTEVWKRWLNSRHVIDDVLSLPQGPGLLVRSTGKDGLARWSLKVLRPEGIVTYTLPIAGRRPFDRLLGDARNGKIVLLLSASGAFWSHDPLDFPSEVLVMELPV